MKADKRVRRTLFAKLPPARIATASRRLSSASGFAGAGGRRAGLLSHGQKQWLEIGMLLMQEPTLLLLDEPVAGMSDEDTERTAELFLPLAGEHSLGGGRARHGLREDALRGRRTALHDGSVLAEGTLDAVQNDERVGRGLPGAMTC